MPKKGIVSGETYGGGSFEPSLGKSGSTWNGALERFRNPGIRSVTLTGDEVTSLCPVTHQPDFYTVVINYGPRDWCIESKSLKLYLGNFRSQGVFGEALAVEVAKKVREDIKPAWVNVSVTQSPRGGISIRAYSSQYEELGQEDGTKFEESEEEAG